MARFPNCREFGPMDQLWNFAVSKLRNAPEGWVVLGLRLGHTLPVIAGIDLNAPLR